jgi:L-ascorbate metabolism protein UlaG (beta-lactamase superfamily)
VSQIEITVLGMAATKISNGSKNIYVDSFIDFKKHPLKPFDFSDADIVLVTHDHADHYDSQEIVSAVRKTNAVVVGPPSIAYPLLVDYSLSHENLRILYHQDPGTPASTIINGVTISSFSSLHFSDGDNMTIHNSYLLEMDGKRLFVTGDSNVITTKDNRLLHLDALIFNFVIFDKDIAKVSLLEETQRKYSPKQLVPVHIIDCDWTIQPNDLSREVAKRNLKSVIILENSQSSLRL